MKRTNSTKGTGKSGTHQDVPPEELMLETAADDAVEADLALPEAETEIGDVSSGAVAAGVDVIRAFWKTLPPRPGVYRMIGRDDEVLYVGKAKNLKARVGNYTRGIGHTNRIARMIAETRSMTFVTTETETEALLLETNYIKQFRPRFNVLMRDDKSFPYILLTGDHAAPQLTKHRGARSRKGDYYGPFASVWAVNRTITALQRAFLVRTCSDSYFANRTRPCLLFQIKRCSGPCTGEVSTEDYKTLVDEAKAFLSGRSRAVKEHMATEMQAAAELMEFERAARLRDRLAALSAVQSSQDVNPQTVAEADVFAIAEEAGQFCIEVFFFRTYQNWGNRAYFPKADRSLERSEVLDAFLTQFYDDKPCPRLILLSHPIENAALLADALCERSGQKVEIATPQRGEKRDLVEHAAKNAREELSRRLAEVASQQKLLEALGQAFALPKTPQRIEVYDNSHIMGTNAVGAMIVAGAAGFMKQHYRTFNMTAADIVPGDDYGMMREMLRRRFQRLIKEAPRSDAGGGVGWPDLVIIDGGKGQFEAAQGILAELGVSDVPLVAIAKGPDRNAGRETFFISGREPFRLPPRDPALYFIQRLRDEAHRFAIGTHRAKRKRDMTKSPLDDIEGIGPSRKRALLLHFGTAKAIARASADDLARVPGINAAMAKVIADYFRGGGA
jgi:excinuclease ABC subunit C